MALQMTFVATLALEEIAWKRTRLQNDSSQSLPIYFWRPGWTFFFESSQSFSFFTLVQLHVIVQEWVVPKRIYDICCNNYCCQSSSKISKWIGAALILKKPLPFQLASPTPWLELWIPQNILRSRVHSVYVKHDLVDLKMFSCNKDRFCAQCAFLGAVLSSKLQPNSYCKPHTKSLHIFVILD